MTTNCQTFTMPFVSMILTTHGEEVASDDFKAVSEYMENVEARRLALDNVLDFTISTVHFGHYSETKGVNYETRVTNHNEQCHPALLKACEILSKRHMGKLEAAEHHQQTYLFIQRLPFLPYGRSWRATKRQFKISGKHNAQGRHLAIKIRQDLKHQRITDKKNELTATKER